MMDGRVLQLLREGYGSQSAGDLVRAEQMYRQALDLDPNSVHGLHVLGVLCGETGRPEEAIDRLRRALSIGGEHAEAHASLGRAYAQLGQLQQAVDHLRRSTEMNPRNAEVFNDLGTAQRWLERPRDAVASYEAALKLDPDSAEFWSNLAAAHNEAKSPDKGLLAVEAALKLDDKLASAWCSKADLLLTHSRYLEAIDCYRKCLELEPDHVTAMINMARAQRDADDPQAALVSLQKALAIEPQSPMALHVLGWVREQMGEFEAAADCYHEAIRAAPKLGTPHYQLAQLKGRRSTDEELATMSSLWEQDDLPPSSRIYLAFGMYRALEQRSEFDRAFEFLAIGNRLTGEKHPYDDIAAARQMDEIVAATESALARLGPAAGQPDPRPVFVLGMPRSGTSLTEQILASHSQVAGAGELSYGSDTVYRSRELTGTAFPGSMELLSAEQMRELGQYYMSRHAPANLAFRFVVDKTPMNYKCVGLLAMALPRARFIHCHRHPVASCFSIYRMPFEVRHTYAHEMNALGRYYSRYWELMKQWHALFPGRILDVRYEDTVADVERQSRRLLDFLGLPFEESVLRFYETERLVKTPSASQVRQPIYSDSLDSWKNYEHHLGPLVENLQPALLDFEKEPALRGLRVT
jgi:tetratricopeptide (TPR) repeat protein